MDPFIESQRWEPFHAAFVPMLAECLVPQLRPRYIVDIQRYVYLINESEGDVEQILAPDGTVVHEGGLRESEGPSAVATLEPYVLTLPMPADFRQNYLVIRSKEQQEVVALIEVLSPWNKRKGDGRTEYLQKRANYLRSETHIVEIDLLRGGERLPLNEPLPPGDYYAHVGRWNLRPKVEVYAWPLRDRLPVIPVPLNEGDPDAALDLHEAFTRTYDRAGYDYALKYQREIVPRLKPTDREWVDGVLARAR